jgi:hypothetical protein
LAGDGWNVRIEAPDPKVRVYLGYLRAGERTTTYQRDQHTGEWWSIPEGEAADEKVRKTLEWLAEQADRRGLTQLEGRWREGGPELIT